MGRRVVGLLLVALGAYAAGFAGGFAKGWADFSADNAARWEESTASYEAATERLFRQVDLMQASCQKLIDANRELRDANASLMRVCR